jgi:plasmid stabilization system protein ParE
MEVKFLAPARAELVEAVAYYESQKQGLGSQFAKEIKRTIQRILQFPEAWAPISRCTRRCRTNRFPYGVIYQVRGDVLLIVAVMHLHREPRTWKDRLTNDKK